MLLATMGVAALLGGREAWAGASLVGAAAIKASAAFVAPFALLAAAREKRLTRLLAGGLAAALLIAVAVYLAFGWHWLGAFGLAGENQGRTSHMSIPVTVARLGGLDPTAVRVVALGLYGALLVYLLIRTARGSLD